MALVVRCPDCREKFSWKSGTALPDACPLCGAKVGSDRPDDEIVLPSIRTMRTRIMDKTYRDMEAGSEKRMELAAQVGGGSPSDYSALKITDMKDNLREGETAAVPVRNAVTEHMARTGQGGFVGGDGTGYSGAVQTGPFPNAGARMRTSVQQYHSSISHGSAVSDRPATETQQPGYRRRG